MHGCADAWSDILGEAPRVKHESLRCRYSMASVGIGTTKCVEGNTVLGNDVSDIRGLTMVGEVNKNLGTSGVTRVDLLQSVPLC
jgi:hypothetical protein